MSEDPILRGATVAGRTFTEQINGPDKSARISFSNAEQVTFNHNLSKRPAIQCFDTAGIEIIGLIEHVDDNTTLIRFSAAKSGYMTAN